jgi:hypothetical protein
VTGTRKRFENPSSQTPVLAASFKKEKSMESQVVGRLKPVEHDDELFVSEPFEIPYFDKKLTIGFIEAKHQPYLDSADSVLRHFLTLTSKDRINDSEPVFKYYDQTLKFGYTKDLNIKTPSEIWNHVRSNEIIIYWDENGDFYLCISCGLTGKKNMDSN